MFSNLNAEQARRGMTNGDVARALNISRVSFENKKKSGRFLLDECKALCVLFACSFEYLFDGDLPQAS